MEHLFKLKKDAKTVGYLKIDNGLVCWRHCDLSPALNKVWHTVHNSSRIDFDTAHLIVTKDKNGEDVFAGDKVIYRPPDIDELCEDEEEELEVAVIGGFLIFDIEGMDFVEASKFRDIELTKEQK